MAKAAMFSIVSAGLSVPTFRPAFVAHRADDEMIQTHYELNSREGRDSTRRQFPDGECWPKMPFARYHSVY